MGIKMRKTFFREISSIIMLFKFYNWSWQSASFKKTHYGATFKNFFSVSWATDNNIEKYDDDFNFE